MRSVSTLIAQLVIGTAVFALNVLLVSIAGFMRALPALGPFLYRLVLGLFLLSHRLYALLLGLVAPSVRRYSKINLLHRGWRLAATLLLSISFGMALTLFIPLPLAGWSLLVFILHGLIVGLTWDDIPADEGIRMGERTLWDN